MPLKLGDAIAEELDAPGKLVARFKLQLDTWTKLRENAETLQPKIKWLETFCADAGDARKDLQVDDIVNQWNELEELTHRGGIRRGTDDREMEGVTPFELINGLEKDLTRVEQLPPQLTDRVDDIEGIIRDGMRAKYKGEHAPLLSAVGRIRNVLNKPQPMFPDTLGNTYAETAADFAACVTALEQEGTDFFADCDGTTFQDYKTLCKLVLNDTPADLYSPEYATHVDNLKSKKLVELRLAE